MKKMITLDVSPANVRNNTLQFKSLASFFPRDSIGGTNRSDPGETLLVKFPELGEEVKTDIDGRHFLFRHARKQFRLLYKQYGYVGGERVYIQEEAPYVYRVSHQKPSDEEGTPGALSIY